MNVYAFLNLATKESKDSILEHDLLYNHEKIMVSITHDRDANNPSELCINITLVVNNLPQKDSQFAIVKIITKLFSADNIFRVSIGYISKHEDRQVGWCTYNVSTLWSTPSSYTNLPTLLGGVSTSYLTTEALTIHNQIKPKSA